MNEENMIQNESVAVERRIDRALKHKGNLEQTKKDDQCECTVRTCMDSEILMT